MDTNQENTKDVASIDAIVKALYESISFPQGEVPDFDRLRSLFFQGARLVPVKPEGAQILDVKAFISTFRQHIESGALKEFKESEIARRIESFGNIAHLFSTYTTKFILNNETLSKRGINSIQLLKDKGRWWVLTIFWNDETEDFPIPAEYLP